MKITDIRFYRKSLGYVGGKYAWGCGDIIDTASTTVVVINTNKGVSGVGEFCPCGNNCMDAHQEGIALRCIHPAGVSL